MILGLLNLCATVLLISSASVADGDQIRVVFIIANDSVSEPEELGRAVQLASEHVNSRNNSLNGQQLQIGVECAYIECDRQQALEVFHSYLFDAMPLAAVIGAGCSLASEAVAEVSLYYNLSTISYASSSISLDNREQFPYLSQVIPSNYFVALGMTEIIDYYNWTRALILTQDTDSFRLLSEELAEMLESNSVDIIDNILLPKNISRITSDSLFPADVRIIALNVDSTIARHILCEASMSLEYRYVWLTQGWYEDRWWEEQGEGPEGANCTADQLLEFLQQQRALAVNHYPSAPHTTAATVSGRSTEEIEESGAFTQKVSYFVYDSVWALVRAVEGLDKEVDSFVPQNISSPLNRGLGQGIRDGVADVSFRGVTGNVNLKGGSRVMNTLQILQYDKETGATPGAVGTIHIQNRSVVGVAIFGEVWPEDKVPSDGTPYTTRRYPYLWLVISSNIFAVITILAAVVCLVFNLVFRKRKLIRLSSPNLNYIIGIGVIVASTSVFFFAYPELPDDVLNTYCWMRTWSTAIGYTLCFGTINTKMWRVYYIFHNPKPIAKKKPLKDIHLFLFVLIFLLVDVVILIICTALDNVRPQADLVPDREHKPGVDDEGITVRYEVTLCDSRWKILWLGVLLGYKVIIQGIGVFLAFKIRKVKIKVLNDSKEIVATLYLSSLILATVIVITLAFGDYLNVYVAGYVYGILLAGIVVLGVVFMSKMVRLYKDPEGSNLFTHVTRNTAASAIATLDDNQIHALQKKVKQLEAQLTNFEVTNDIPLTEMKLENGKYPITPPATTPTGMADMRGQVPEPRPLDD